MFPINFMPKVTAGMVHGAHLECTGPLIGSGLWVASLGRAGYSVLWLINDVFSKHGGETTGCSISDITYSDLLLTKPLSSPEHMLTVTFHLVGTSQKAA